MELFIRTVAEQHVLAIIITIVGIFVSVAVFACLGSVAMNKLSVSETVRESSRYKLMGALMIVYYACIIGGIVFFVIVGKNLYTTGTFGIISILPQT